MGSNTKSVLYLVAKSWLPGEGPEMIHGYEGQGGGRKISGYQARMCQNIGAEAIEKKR
jgi:hypothetical protein